MQTVLKRVPEGWTLDGEIQIGGMREELDITAFVQAAERFIALGATIIGGCCGIEPSYIEALSKRLR